MVAYSFKTLFALPIIAKTKRHTIRDQRTGRSRHARPGEALQLYTGMRTRQCRMIGLATCESVSRIALDFVNGVVNMPEAAPGGISYHWPGQLDGFARADGFANWSELAAFWKTEHSEIRIYVGVIIGWGDSFREAGT